ncbi:MAG TPA: PEP-CTERM sorting domain-containing protein [Caulobacteraceae bacterium]|jgi:hypothetical protein
MSNIRYAAAMLAAGGAAGAAASAQALTVVTLDLPPSATVTEYITLTSSGGTWSTTSSPDVQYSFGPKTTSLISDATLFGSTSGLEGDINSGWPNSTTVFTPNGEYPADFFGKVVVGGPTDLQIEFTAGGTTYWGLADFAQSGELETISFDAVPEPEAWALLLAGIGLAGGALRGARRRRQAIAA